MSKKTGTTSATKTADKTKSPQTNAGVRFGKMNYILLFAGLVLIIGGFLLMSGGGSKDPNEFSPEIFSPRRITLAPILVLLGFAINAAAIMWKPKNND